jgi:hypothetical protein
MPLPKISAHASLYRRNIDRLMRWDEELPDELITQLWRDPASLLSKGKTLQEKSRGKVVLLESAEGPFVLKWQSWGNVARTVRRSLSPTAGRRSWIQGHKFRAQSIPTPCPRAYFERRVGPFATHSYFLTDLVAGASLYRFLRFEHPSPGKIADLADQVAAIWQRLSDLQICHNDFKTENFMVDPAGKAWLIDLEMARRYRRTDRLRQRQAREIRDLLHPRNWRANPAAAEVFRQALLKTRAGEQLLESRHGEVHVLGEPRPTENQASQLVTVLIPCHDGVPSLSDCLDSLRDMADEILIAHNGPSGSVLAESVECGGCRIIEKQCNSAAEFMDWAREQAQHPWILEVHPNERLSSCLARRVQDLLATDVSEDGFTIQQTHYKNGRPLGTNPSQDASGVRLYRTDRGTYESPDGRPHLSLPVAQVGHVTSQLFVDLPIPRPTGGVDGTRERIRIDNRGRREDHGIEQAA